MLPQRKCTKPRIDRANPASGGRPRFRDRRWRRGRRGGAAGQTIVTVAQQGGIDAVFDVPVTLIRQVSPDALITVTLSDDRTVRAIGNVRELAIAKGANDPKPTFAIARRW